MKTEGGSLWVRILKEKYGVEGGEVKTGVRFQSRWWSDLQKIEEGGNGIKQNWFSNVIKKEVGSGENTLFWHESWLDGGPLDKRFGRLYSLNTDKHDSMTDIVTAMNGSVDWTWHWRRPLFQWESDQLMELQQLVLNARLKWEGLDRWAWMKDYSGSYSVRSTYKWL